MKLILIEISCPDTRALGVRALSSYVKAQGGDCQMIFLPPAVERMTAGSQKMKPYSKRLLDSIASAVGDADLIGISLLSYYFDFGLQLTEMIQKKFSIPVIWGGYHPMGEVEKSLEYADFVCMGEGEQCLVDLLSAFESGRNGLDTPNLAFKSNNQIVRNPLQPLIQDLDSLPFLDYHLDIHLASDSDKDELTNLDRSRSMQFAKMGPLSRIGTHYHYQTFMSRGCPYNCAYCCESLVHSLYKGQRQLRRRSPENLAVEIDQMRRSLDFVSAIAFSDDSFSEASDEEIGNFAAVYKRSIGLPFSAQFSPLTLNQFKIDALIDAGLKYIEVGIQTGSDRTKKMYHRRISNDRVLDSARILKDRIGSIIPPDYHFIVDNPWESADDLIGTLKLILEIPKPRGIKISSLVFYPGTDLAERANAENRIQDVLNQVYRKNFGALNPTTINLLFFLCDIHWMPNSMIRFLNKPFFINKNGPIMRQFVKIVIFYFSLLQRFYNKMTRIFRKQSN